MTDTLAAPLHPDISRILSAGDVLQLMRSLRDALPVRFDLSGLDRVLRIDADRQLIEVQAATRWSALAARLAPEHAWAAGLASWAGSIGASAAENAPAADGTPSVALIESLTVATPDGELRRISRELHPELFALAIGGQGVIAMPYSITLRLAALREACEEASALAKIACVETSACEPQGVALRLLLPPAQSASFAASMRAQLEEWRLAPLAVEARAVRAESETFLRWATRDWALIALTLPQSQTIGQRVRLEQAQRELIDSAIACGGSFPIACTPAASRAQVEACYPSLRAFLAERRRQDPRECLHNAWYRHHRNLFSREACEVRWEN
jgi:hypothetical protein